MKHVVVYTDGACLGNPWPGGYGTVILYGGRRKELSGGFRLTTNNRMELLAAIDGLEALKECCKVTLFSDSKYVVDSMEQGWARKWRAKGWRRNKKAAALNPDLWDRLIGLTEGHEVDFQWVKGHAGIPANERCDQLAMEAATSNPQKRDAGYEKTIALGEFPRKTHCRRMAAKCRMAKQQIGGLKRSRTRD